MIRFQRKYFIWAIILFITEVLIAAFVHDKIVRPYFGDFLVVILIYCFIKSFLDIPVFPLAVSVLLFAYLIELLQYYGIAQRLGLEKSGIARIVIGSSFGWMDLVAYTAGIFFLLFLEKRSNRALETGENP